MAACALKQLDPKHYWVVLCDEVPTKQVAVCDGIIKALTNYNNQENTDKTGGRRILVEMLTRAIKSIYNALEGTIQLCSVFIHTIMSMWDL